MSLAAQAPDAPTLDRNRDLRDSSRAALVRDVTHLASSALDGRATGTPGADSAAEYLAKAYLALQVDPGIARRGCAAATACGRSYFQAFKPPLPVLRAAGIDTTAYGLNVVAIVPGTDAALAHEWIVIGAHYDHLGRTGYGARDPRTGRLPHLGADDNASGTAAVLELARRIASAPLARSVLFVHFGAEELGLLGALAFLTDPPVPTTAMVAMINLDMVGRLGGSRLQLYGLGSAPGWRTLADSAGALTRVTVDRNLELGPRGTGSDHAPFVEVGIPAIHLFTGQHSAWHTRDDTVGKIDFDGLVRVVEFAEQLARLVGDGARLRGEAP